VFYAKPLVYTPPGSAHELVITVSNQNIIRVIDGVTGALVKSRTLAPPFQAADSNCGDIPNTIGITGTPIIVSTPIPMISSPDKGLTQKILIEEIINSLVPRMASRE
jgi:hypothetical protein